MSVQDILKAIRDGQISAQDAKAALQKQRVPAERSGPDPASTVAVIGMSGRYPDAADLAQYWQNLAAGRDSIREFPRQRWDAAESRSTSSYADWIYCPWMGALDDIECFDPLFFNISPAEAELIDPQHRLFLEESYKAFAHAGYAKQALSETRCGVYFGVVGGEYHTMSMFSNAGVSATGVSDAIGAARIGYYLNLKGPAIAVNCACSSALVGVHLACQSLRSGEIDMALAGGATLYLSPNTYVGMCAANMLSHSGRCRAFDDGADGFVPGEGVGAVVLKRLGDAQAAGDTIYGLIVASGVNQNGRTNGITAPSKKSQTELVRDVYERFAIDAAGIGYIEAHASGSALGDPMELEALAAAHRARSDANGYCAIGSVKSNIGHAYAAAGIAALHKALLVVRHATLVPSLHYGNRNRHFDFSRSPFYVNTETRPWLQESAAPRRAAVSAFGFSGTNAHVVIEEYAEAAREPAIPSGAELIVLSAPTLERLRTCAQALARRLAQEPPTLRDVAYTLQVGRDAAEHRLAVVVESGADLIKALEQFLAGTEAAGLSSGTANRKDPAVADAEGEDDPQATQQAWFNEGELARLGALWTRGLDVDWVRLRADTPARRVALPLAPLDAGRYWIGMPAASAGRAAAAAPAVAPPPAISGGSFRDNVAAQLAHFVGTALKIPPAQLNPSRPLADYGMDSIQAMQLAGGMAGVLPDLSPLLFIEYQTLDALTDHLLETRAEALLALVPDATATVVTAAAAPARRSGGSAPRPVPIHDRDIAVIGLAGRYAGANDIDSLWQRLRDGADCISEIPVSRWDHAPFFDADKGRFGKSYCRWGSFIDGVDLFDALFFDVSPKNAAGLDPQIRLTLQTTWEAFENAGYSRPRMKQQHNAAVGVYVGAITQQYQQFETDYVVSAMLGLSSYAAIANRVSHFFDLKGPSVAVDTMCSAALVAVHMACRALADGECELAVAGGVNLLIHPKKYLGLSALLMLGSHRGCRSFADSDGYLPGEGVGMVVLKPLGRAEADGDTIQAVIRHTAQKHSGRGIGFGSQDPNAQMELVRGALQRSGIDPRTIGYVEAAAHGVSMSDAVEVSALSRVFREWTPDTGFCALGSVQANLGHLEAATGIAQLTKVILQLRHGQIAPALRVDNPNPLIDLKPSPFFFPTELMPWPRTVIEVDGQAHEFPRRAAINTFGGGGSLVNLLIEEYIAPAMPAEPSAAAGDDLAVLSARTPERLVAVARRLLQFAMEQPDAPFDGIVHTLQRGREALRYRTAFLAADRDGLLQGLRHLAGEPDAAAPRGLHSGDADEAVVAPRELAAPVAARDLETLAALWVRGAELPWEALRGRPGRLLSLPGYPFDTQRYWLEQTDRTTYAQSFVHGDAPESRDHRGIDIETIVRTELCDTLGLPAEEFDMNLALGRYEMLSVFLPRFRDRLHAATPVRLDVDALMNCRTPRDIAAIATLVEA